MNKSANVLSEEKDTNFSQSINKLDNSVKRETGIDFLRILSMFLVIILHILGNGGILNNIPWMSKQYVTAWFLEIIAYCAVDCFALISGYVGINANFRWSKLISFWLQVAFYTIGITLVFAILYPESITIVEWVNAFFPVTARQYWYITAYAGLFLFIPFLNISIQKTNRKQLNTFLIIGAVAFCFLPCVLQKSPYGLSDGYSMAWLIILYIAGGYIKKYNIAKVFTRKMCVVIFGISTIIILLSKITIELITSKVLGYAVIGNTFVSYLSPFVVVNAVTLICFFAQTNFKTTLGKKMVSIFSQASLGVYIIHVHPLIYNKLVKDCAIKFVTYNPLKLVIFVIGLAFAICLGCSIIEIIRLKLFKVLKIKALCSKVD